MKKMNVEMQMYESHLTEYKLEIDRINKDLTTTKKRYYQLRKRE